MTDKTTAPNQSHGLYKDASGNFYETVPASPPDGMVHFSRQGGGFVMQLTAADFAAKFTRADLPTYSAIEVDADWLPDGMTLPAYSNGMRWNGWAMPYFERDTATRLLAIAEDLTYDEAADHFVMKGQDGDEADVFAATMIEVDGKTIKVYPVGLGSWTWSFVKNPCATATPPLAAS